MIFLYYIQGIDKPKKILNLFNRIKLEENKIILPISEDSLPITNKKAEKLAKKTKEMLDRSISKRIVISEKLQQQKDYMNWLSSYPLEMIEGKWLFEILSYDVLAYILEKRGMKKEETRISVLVNDLSENMLENLIKIAQEYKRVNIITNHIEKFKKIEKKIFDENGIMITVGNNKRKGLSKSALILNVDFPNELINQYHIYEKAILVNIRGKIKIAKKRFNGITINDYEITFKEIEQFDDDRTKRYKMAKIYEAQMNKKQPYQEIMKQIKKDKVEIKQLMGINITI